MTATKLGWKYQRWNKEKAKSDVVENLGIIGKRLSNQEENSSRKTMLIDAKVNANGKENELHQRWCQGMKIAAYEVPGPPRAHTEEAYDPLASSQGNDDAETAYLRLERPKGTKEVHA
ncbi:hypothetical protein C8J56DRAFT_898987 [Mycena floridula]|nr:hypothetical protein C8J56DRAFT_898987 [Mycena floridula]